MKLVIKRDDLALAAQSVHRMVNAASSLPILSNILVKANPERAEFVASDLESSVKCTVPAQAEGDFVFTVPAQRFSSMAKELPDSDVTLELTDDKVKVTCETLEYNLATLDPVDFPAWPEYEAKATLHIQQQELRRAFDSVIFAIPTRDPRKVLLGAFIDINGLDFKCVGTDGKKLGFVKTTLEEHTGTDEISAIVPHKIMSEILQNPRQEGITKIEIGERQIAFNLGNVMYVTNKLEGTYPNYQRVIPEDFQKRMRMNRANLTNCIRQAAIIAEEKNNSVKFMFKKGELDIEANTYDVGSFAGSMPIDYDGDDFEMVFNHRFISEVLRVIGKDEIDLKATKAVSPAVFTGADDEDALFVIMPIKLADLADGSE